MSEIIFASQDNLLESIPMPQGALISVFGASQEQEDALKKKFRTSREWQEDTAFALIYDISEGGCYAWACSERKVGYGVVGKSVLPFFLQNALYHGSTPFFFPFSLPKLICSNFEKNGSFYAGMIRLVMRECEKMSYFAQRGEDPNLEKINDLCSILDEKRALEFIFDAKRKGGEKVDGLLQAESALYLLYKQNQKEIKRNECAVLLAYKLVKVYNIFIEILPRCLFPSDSLARAEFIRAKLGCNEQIKIESEYEIRKKHFLIRKNQDRLKRIWNFAQFWVREFKEKYENSLLDYGFCMDYDEQDLKKAIFISPDLIQGETLLADIKNAGFLDL